MEILNGRFESIVGAYDTLIRENRAKFNTTITQEELVVFIKKIKILLSESLEVKLDYYNTLKEVRKEKCSYEKEMVKLKSNLLQLCNDNNFIAMRTELNAVTELQNKVKEVEYTLDLVSNFYDKACNFHDYLRGEVQGFERFLQ